MGFDLSKANKVSEREDAGSVVQIMDETGEPLFYGEGNDKPVTITVAGEFSRVYRRAEDAIRGQQLKRRGNLTPQELRRQSIELLSRCVLAWEGFENAGQPLDCTRENVSAVLSSAEWIRKQVDQATTDHSAPFGKPSQG